MSQPQSLELGVFDIPLSLSSSLEPHRAQLQARLAGAQSRLKKFAQAHQWLEHVLTPFALQARIFADKQHFDHDLLELACMYTTIELPKTYCAALVQQVLVSVSPELYAELYPEGDESDAFEKLLTHEMAHRLHIRILNGDEEKMGPIWFYEGFALYAADQFAACLPALNAAEIWETVQTEERIDYRRYAAVFCYFLELAPLGQLIEHAGHPEFAGWLQQISSSAKSGA